MAVLIPRELGENVILNVVLDPPAIVLKGAAVKLKSLKLTPPIVTIGVPIKFNVAIPKF